MVNSISHKLQKLKSNLNLKRTLSLVWVAAKGWVILSLMMIVMETLLFLGSIYALKLLVDQLSHQNPAIKSTEGDVLKSVILAGALTVLYSIAKAISSYVTEAQSTKVSNYIDEKIHHTAVQMELAHYESPDYFDILKRAKDAGADRPNLIITTMVEILKNIFSLIGVSSLFITINWFLLPLLVLFILPTLAVRIYFANKQNIWRIKHTPLERKSTYISTLLTSDVSAKEIRSFNLGPYFKNQYQVIRAEVIKQRLKLSYKRTINEAVTTSIGSVGFFACVGYIALGTFNGKTSVGDIVLFLLLFPQSFNIMQSISAGISVLYQNNIFINSIFELFDLKSSFENPANPQEIPDSNNLDLELKNIDFQYPNAAKQTLNNISLKIPSGKIIAIVGLNGAGKSTLIKLLCRLYDPQSGSINLGNVNIKNFEVDKYRKQISVVFQDFSKYNVSVGDNIRFGNIEKAYDQEAIEIAARNSGADQFIKTFEKGYDTTMGRLFEDGQEVSIGQWQKLAIARAFYSSARIIVMDEATSALDAIAEKDLFDSFRNRIGTRSAVIISHRHSAVKHADYIYVLSGGQILQEGTDQELLSMEGDYANLFKSEA